MKNDNINRNVIDTEFLNGIIENDVEFKKELFLIFLENVSRNVSKMEEAIVSGENNSWYMAAHAFKGASASVGAFMLSKLLEHAQKNPEESTEQKKATLATIKKEVQLVVDFINGELAA